MFTPCPKPEACLPNNVCNEALGYADRASNNFCLLCKDDYGRVVDNCEAGPAGIMVVVFVLLGLFGVVLVVLYLSSWWATSEMRASKQAIGLAVLKIFFSYLQISGLLMQVQLQYPAAIKSTTHLMEASVNLELSLWSWGCFGIPGFFWEPLFVTLVAPEPLMVMTLGEQVFSYAAGDVVPR